MPSILEEYRIKFNISHIYAQMRYLIINIGTQYTTLIPVLVASREASSSGSNIGLNATVNAQSIICPVKTNVVSRLYQ